MRKLPQNTREKSLLLEEIMSLSTTYGYGGYCLVYQAGELIGGSTAYWYDDDNPHVDLYDEHNMALAWLAITYANAELDEKTQRAFNKWWQEQQIQKIAEPTKAQEMWLDKVLELGLLQEMMGAQRPFIV